MASYVEKLREQRRKEKLAREYSHPSSGYVPTKQEIDEAIAVGTGRKPQDVAYGEQGLQAPAVAGGLVSLDPTDYLSGAGLAKIAAMAKVGGLGLASLAGGMTAMHKMGAQSVPRMFGQAGMFAGRGAKTANLAMLAKAEEMAKAGIPDSQIWKETGWALDTPDKLPRFEIPDNAAQFKKGGIEKMYDYGYRPQEQIFSHDELYKAYPDAGKIQTTYTSGDIADVAGEYGAHYSPDNTISLGVPRKNTDLARAGSINTHELQHAIQQREGFASGGSPETSAGVGMTKDNTMEFARKAYEEAHQTSGDPLLEELLGSAKKWEELTPREQLGWIDQGRMTAYRNLAGEAEARLTQARMNLTPEERLAQYPYDPEYFQGATGVSLKDLIVRQK